MQHDARDLIAEAEGPGWRVGGLTTPQVSGFRGERIKLGIALTAGSAPVPSSPSKSVDGDGPAGVGEGAGRPVDGRLGIGGGAHSFDWEAGQEGFDDL